MKQKDFWEILSIISWGLAFILAIIVIVQILRSLFWGSWEIENIILTIVIFNLTICFGIWGYLLHINNKISEIDKVAYGHIEWHKGKNSKKW